MYNTFPFGERRLLPNLVPARRNNRPLPIQVLLQCQQALHLPKGEPCSLFLTVIQASVKSYKCSSNNTANLTRYHTGQTGQQIRYQGADSYSSHPSDNRKPIRAMQVNIRHTDFKGVTTHRCITRDSKVNRSNPIRSSARVTQNQSHRTSILSTHQSNQPHIPRQTKHPSKRQGRGRSSVDGTASVQRSNNATNDISRASANLTISHAVPVPPASALCHTTLAFYLSKTSIVVCTALGNTRDTRSL